MDTPHPLTLYRLKAGLTQTDLSRLLGVRKATVSRWEAGKRTPAPPLWARIKAVTNGAVTIDAFASERAAQ